MNVLGFDTATAATAVALRIGDHAGPLTALHAPEPGERPGHATRLLPLVEEVLARAGIGWDEVDRLVVGTGPGSFTGLRIGIATARALAQARALPLIGSSTLRALAAAAQAAEEPTRSDRPVFAVLDARRGEAFAAAWRDGEEVLSTAARTPADLAAEVARLPAPPLAVGDGAVRFRSELQGAGATVPEDASPLHTINAGWHCRLAAGAPDPSAAGAPAVLPDYARLPDAELARRRRAADP